MKPTRIPAIPAPQSNHLPLQAVRRSAVRAFEAESLPGERDRNRLPFPRLGPAGGRPVDFGRPGW